METSQEPQAESSAKKSSTTKIVVIIIAVVLVLSCLVCGGLVALLIPALGTARQAAYQQQGFSNMRQIGLGVVVYANDNNDAMPHDLQLLQQYIYDSSVFLDPENTTFVALPGPTSGPASRYGDTVLIHIDQPLINITNPSKTIVIYRAHVAPGQNERTVGFVDGHVEQLDETTFRSMIDPEIDVDALDGPNP